MEVYQFSGARTFLAAVEDFLLEREVSNSLMLGLALQLEKESRSAEFYAVMESGKPQLAAMHPGTMLAMKKCIDQSI